MYIFEFFIHWFPLFIFFEANKNKYKKKARRTETKLRPRDSISIIVVSSQFSGGNCRHPETISFDFRLRFFLTLLSNQTFLNLSFR